MSKVDKNLSITHIREMSEKYDVTIEIKFGDNFRTIVENDEETHVIKNGFDVNLVEEIEKTCKEMQKREHKRMQEVTERLNNLEPSIFPDDLMDKYK